MPFHIRRKKTLNISASHKKNLIELLPNAEGDVKSEIKFWAYVEKVCPETVFGEWHSIRGSNIPGKIEIREGKYVYRFFPWVISWSK